MEGNWKHGGDIYTDGMLKGKELLDYSSNINPLGVPNSVKENIDNIMNTLVRYPDYKYRKLKEAVSTYHNKYEKVSINNEWIILGNGASEILEAFIKQCKSIVIAVPSFSEYEEFAIKNNLEVIFSKLNNDMSYNYEDIKRKLVEADGIMLANPNNPTGTLLNKDNFINILNYANENNKVVIVDEAFVEFCENKQSVSNLISKYKCLYIVRAVTKFFGMPGIRVGYGLSSNTEILEKMKSNQLPWNINSFGEYATIYSFNDEIYIDKSKKWIKEEKEYMYNKLKKIDIFEKIYKPSCNFILCKLKENNNTFYNYMIKQGVLIRKAGNFKELDDTYVRLAIKDREKNDLVIKIIYGLMII